MKTSSKFAIMALITIATNIFFVPIFKDVEKFSWDWFSIYLMLGIIVSISYIIVTNFLDYCIEIINKLLDNKK